MILKKPVHMRLLSLPKYQKRISGLMLDWIDIHVEVSRVDYGKFILFIRAKLALGPFGKLV